MAVAADPNYKNSTVDVVSPVDEEGFELKGEDYTQSLQLDWVTDLDWVRK